MAEPDVTVTKRDRREAALIENFGQDSPNYQYAFVNFLVEHLTDLSRSYGGDFQQVLVLAVLGQRRLNVLRSLPSRDMLEPAKTAITASRLADVTGIPRETVRRKLELLQRRGWVTQGADGAWLLAADSEGQDLPARRGNADLEIRARKRIARLVAVLETVGSKRRD